MSHLRRKKLKEKISGLETLSSIMQHIEHRSRIPRELDDEISQKGFAAIIILTFSAFFLITRNSTLTLNPLSTSPSSKGMMT